MEVHETAQAGALLALRTAQRIPVIIASAADLDELRKVELWGWRRFESRAMSRAMVSVPGRLGGGANVPDSMRSLGVVGAMVPGPVALQRGGEERRRRQRWFERMAATRWETLCCRESVGAVAGTACCTVRRAASREAQ